MARNRIYFGGEIAVKYGCDWGGWSSREIPGSYGISLWKNIWRGIFFIGKDKNRYIWHGWNSFYSFLKFDIGDGTQVKCWYNTWCGDHPIKEEFMEIFGIAPVRNTSVADLLRLCDGDIYCDLSFTQSMQDLELESLSVFMDLLYSIPVRGSRVDKICWRFAKGAQFYIGNFRTLSVTVEASFAWKVIWKSRVPSRVAFCVDGGVGENLDY